MDSTSNSKATEKFWEEARKKTESLKISGIKFVQYNASYEERYLPSMRALISRDLSEPYSIYVYRYFLYQWEDLCFMALSESDDALVGIIICKLERHTPPSRGSSDVDPMRGYIAMIAVEEAFRKIGIATKLVRLALDEMIASGAQEIVLETEVNNEASMRLYESLGFIRMKKLYRYYLNGNEAFRLGLALESGVGLQRDVSGNELQKDDKG